MKIYVQNLLEKLILCSLILSPFDALNISSIAMFRMGFFWPTILGIIIFFITMKMRKDYLLNINISIKLWIAWLVYILIGVFLNMNNILGVEFKGRSAEIRVLSIYIVFIFILLIMVYYNVVLKNKDNIIRWTYSGIKYSFYIVGVYSIIQFMSILNIDIASNFISVTQSFINNAPDDIDRDFSTYRINGVSLEASTFSNYMTVVFPWLIIGAFYIDKSKFMKFSCLLSILFIIFSYSRTGYALFCLEFIIILFWISNNKRKILFYTLPIAFLGLIFIYNSEFSENIVSVIYSFSSEASDGRLYSNLTRLGLQFAALNMFFDNPIFGVGIAQFQFNVIPYLPIWSYITPEIQGVMDKGDVGFFYGTFNTYLRILAESGIIGFFIWISITYHGFKNYFRLINCFKQKNNINIIKLITVSYLMAVMGFMNFDTYLFFFYWFLLILSDVLVQRITSKNNSIE